MPLRAKPRISSRCSHAFFSRFRRSMRWALFSGLGCAGVINSCAKNKKPTTLGFWSWADESAWIARCLDRPAPYARRRAHTTPATTAGRDELLAGTGRHGLDSIGVGLAMSNGDGYRLKSLEKPATEPAKRKCRENRQSQQPKRQSLAPED